jgi:GTP-binding protein HflX
LVGVFHTLVEKEESASLLDELAALVETLAIPVAKKQLIRVPEPSSRYFVGSGKAEEIAAQAHELGADVIVFDNALQPAQQRNWEALAKVAVIDRQEVILDIFAQRAHTKEARLQVDLARLEYSLPRLTRAWGHLSRQAGGLGAKGEGETQLETDRRLDPEKTTPAFAAPACGDRGVHKCWQILSFAPSDRSRGIGGG